MGEEVFSVVNITEKVLGKPRYVKKKKRKKKLMKGLNIHFSSKV